VKKTKGVTMADTNKLKAMRLDKRVAKALGLSRNQARKMIKADQICVNGQICNDISLHIQATDLVEDGDKSLKVCDKRYIMLHKPVGYLSTHAEAGHPSAYELLQPLKLERLHCVGRLDIDTSGLLLISDDGQWSHQITAPSKKHRKCYQVKLAELLDQQQKQQLEQGILLKDSDKLTKPTQIEMIEGKRVKISLTEGRYHQVKRMFAAVGNHVESLHRESIGKLTLDEELKLGQWRNLTTQEIKQFE